MSVDIELIAPATVTATTTRGSLSIEHAEPASISLDEATGDLTITSSAPAAVSIETTSTSIEIVTQAAAVVTIDAQSTPSVSLGQHDALDSLAHEIAETSETEFAYDGDGNVTRVTVWTSSARTTKVREKLLTYASGVLTQSVATQHDGDGVAIATLTKTFIYDINGNLVTATATRS